MVDFTGEIRRGTSGSLGFRLSERLLNLRMFDIIFLRFGYILITNRFVAEEGCCWFVGSSEGYYILKLFKMRVSDTHICDLTGRGVPDKQGFYFALTFVVLKIKSLFALNFVYLFTD